jgi:hypothetical protein
MTFNKIKNVVQKLIENNEMNISDIETLKLETARLIAPFLNTKDTNYVQDVVVHLSEPSGSSVAVYIYDERAIYIANPKKLLQKIPFIHYFYTLTDDIYVKMFSIVFAHEMVHAWQHYNNCGMTRCLGEAHANAVSLRYAKEYNMEDVYELGVQLLGTFYRLKDFGPLQYINTLLGRKNVDYMTKEFFNECYIKKASKISLKAIKCKKRKTKRHKS